MSEDITRYGMNTLKKRVAKAYGFFLTRDHTAPSAKMIADRTGIEHRIVIEILRKLGKLK